VDGELPLKHDDMTARETLFKSFFRISGYGLMRVVSLLVTVAIAVYLTILIANMGGYIDEIIRSEIDESIGTMLQAGWLRDVPLEERPQLIEEARHAMVEDRGLDQPFLLRSFIWLRDGLTLNLGEAGVLASRRYGFNSQLVRDILLANMPNSLLLFATANIMLFITSVWMALIVSRKHGGWLDSLTVVLSPLSSAPSWFFGVVLIFVFAVKLLWLPYGGMYSSDPSKNSDSTLTLTVLKHMILPVSAIVLSSFFQSVYNWRTFFLIYSQDDYVEMARARGLPRRIIESRYLLRPTLPALLTNFSFLLISSWSGSVLLELVFNWPGLGLLFFNAIMFFDTPVIVGFTIIYAYMIALTVLILDILYSVLDPRVKLDLSGRAVSNIPGGIKEFFRNLFGPRHKRLRAKTSFSLRHTLTRSVAELKDWLNSADSILREIGHYPSAIIGLLMIFLLIGTAVYVSATTSAENSIRIWRGQGYDWSENPELAPPAWVNYFRKEKLPETLTLDSREGDAEEMVSTQSGGMYSQQWDFTLDFPYRSDFPQDLLVAFTPTFESKPPLVTLTLISPDGVEYSLDSFSVKNQQSYYLSQDEPLKRRLKTLYPEQFLFSDGNSEDPKPYPGQYRLVVSVVHFDPNASLDARVILYGQVYGWAGTDSYRRDLAKPLIWGLPIVLLFGLLAVLGSTIFTMIFAALGVWFGGWVDALIQRLNEVNMVVPLFPILAMVAAFYERNIWLLLGVTILFSIFGSAIKNYRAIFLQFREFPYIEAAQSYGAGNWRIIFRYLIPRILPTLIPQMVILVPGYVFMEASLALMGLSDPRLPTWGKILRDAINANAFIGGHYYWVLEPLALLLLTGFSFALLGFALDRIFNPRLRDH
jgi:peptide/nickel transport system permease protein